MNEYQTKLYKKLPFPVLVVTKDFRVVFANSYFISIFGNLTNIKKFQHSFNFDVCVLDNANISNYNPIIEAIESEIDYSAFISYQTHKRDVLSFDFTSFKDGKYTVMFFKDETEKTKIKKLQSKFERLNSDLKNAQVQHKKFVQLEQKSREEAVKMSVLNKISYQIRNSIHVDVIIKTALVELLAMINGFKSYWAVPDGEYFVIKQFYPDNQKELNNQKIEFDSSVKKNIYAKKYDISNCYKEYLNSSKKYDNAVHRIIIPVCSNNDFFGVIVLLTKQTSGIKQIVDIFNALSTQIAAEIVQASLFKQLNDKNIELERTLVELKETQIQLINTEKMASLGHLIAGVAHEINTPIGSINSNNALIKKLIDKIETKINNQEQNYLNILKNTNNIDKEAIKRISKIVSSLKKFVRLDEAELQEANINTELDLTIDLIRHETKNKIIITKNYKDIPTIKCYPNMLNQVFMNILVNAIQSIENKGEIIITTGCEDNKLFVSIKDTGCGMDEKTINNIFMPGFTTKGVGVGTGIGLAITHKIIEKHNGKIDVFSEVGVGSEFVIKLPIDFEKAV